MRDLRTQEGRYTRDSATASPRILGRAPNAAQRVTWLVAMTE